jgi:branched-chain amino acid transport system substrate-binding protein
MQRGRLLILLTIVAAAVSLGLTAATASAHTDGVASASRADAGTVRVGIVYSRTGLLAAYGAEYIQGLRLGLKYLTNGTNTVAGKKIELTLSDDATDPAKAVSAGKDLIGQGYKIIAGSTSSGVALQMGALAAQNRVLFISGPAASDGVTALNRYTFRSGRQTYQDILTADSFLGNAAGRKIVVFAQDSVFGAGNYAAVNAVIGGKGHTVSRILVPLTASDFTPFARQAKEANPDLLFVAWAGTTAPAMWTALEQQGVFGVSNKVVTGLAERATWTTFGSVATKIQFLSHYIYTGPAKTNKQNNWLVKQMKKNGQVPDLFTPDGFVAAQMIVRAIRTGGGDNVDKMIAGLEGWKFNAPKGPQQIRKSDHAMLQPMFQAKLVSVKGKLQPKVLGRVPLGRTSPPAKQMP